MNAIEARRRRLRDGIQSVRDSIGSEVDDATKPEVPDAVARALDSLYDLAELVKKRGAYTNATLDDLADSDPAGRVTLALVCARGAKTHLLVDFGDLHTFGSHGFGEGPFGGGWAWQPFEDRRFGRRSTWYANHVRGQSIVAPLDIAYDWLLSRPELDLH